MMLVFLFHLQTEIIGWDQPQLEGGPTPRNGHSLTALPTCIVLFGGIARETGSRNDLYVLDTSCALFWHV
jgi:hypothetical protein